MLSKMLRVKNSWPNKLGLDQLEILLRISEEGPSIEEWSPEVPIDIWYDAKVHRLTTGAHNYPKIKKIIKPCLSKCKHCVSNFI